MGCCGNNTLPPAPPEPEFVVKAPDGTTQVVKGEHAARVAATIAGIGATYSRR